MLEGELVSSVVLAGEFVGFAVDTRESVSSVVQIKETEVSGEESFNAAASEPMVTGSPTKAVTADLDAAEFTEDVTELLEPTASACEEISEE